LSTAVRADPSALCYTARVLTLLLLACDNDSDLNRVRKDPEVAITTPALGAILRAGEGPVMASATVSDSFTPVGELEITWKLGGFEGVAEAYDTGIADWELPLGADDLGEHTLTVTVTDGDGDTGEASVTFTLAGPRGAPDVTIVLPGDGSTFGVADTITFQGTATDTTTPAEALSMRWEADGVELPGAISGNGDSVVLATLPGGVHTVTLFATDEDGEVGSDSITVLVEDVPVEAEPGDLVFSEMMIDPDSVDDNVGEWVELYNTSGSTIDIGGYRFHDDDVDGWTLEGEILVGPGDYVVLCADTNTAVNGGVPCDASFFRDSTGNGLALANGPDEVILSRPDGTAIDGLHYDETWYTKGVALGVDPAWQRSGDNDDPTHWCDQVTVILSSGEPGTPGQANDTCETGEL
jgi:hypothetical protein